MKSRTGTVRLVEYLLVLTLILSQPQLLSAQTTDQTGESRTIHDTASAVNPLYPDEAITEDHETDPGSGALDASLVGENSRPYTSIKAAGAYLREQMKLRKKTVEIPLRIKLTESQFKYITSSIYNNAVKHTGVPDEGDYLKFQYGGGSIERDGSYTNSVFEGTITFNMTYYSSLQQEKEVTAKVEEVLDSLDLNRKSDYEIVKAIYDYIQLNTTYDDEHLTDKDYTLKYTAYAALINKTAICQGYSVLLYRMLLEAGIDCRIISGTGTRSYGSGPHTWALIRMGSYYYNSDVTWDSDQHTHRYFLRGNSEDKFPGHTPDPDVYKASFWKQYILDANDYDPVNPEPEPEPIKLKKPAAPKVTSTAEGVRLDFSKPSGASYCQVFRKTGHITVALGKTSKKTYVDKTAKNGVTYSYSLKAFGVGKESAFSKATKVLYLSAPPKPAAKATDKKKILVSWKINREAHGYQIRYSLDPSFKKCKVVKVEGTKTVEKEIENLKSGSVYYFQVRSFRRASGKNWYSAWSKKRKMRAK